MPRALDPKRRAATSGKRRATSSLAPHTETSSFFASVRLVARTLLAPPGRVKRGQRTPIRGNIGVLRAAGPPLPPASLRHGERSEAVQCRWASPTPGPLRPCPRYRPPRADAHNPTPLARSSPNALSPRGERARVRGVRGMPREPRPLTPRPPRGETERPSFVAAVPRAVNPRAPETAVAGSGRQSEIAATQVQPNGTTNGSLGAGDRRIVDLDRSTADSSYVDLY